MKFAEEFVESAHQVATMVAMMQTITGKEIPLIFDTQYGRVVIRVEKFEEPKQTEEPTDAQPTPEVD